MILQKLRYRQEGARERHVRDVRAMLRVLGNAVNVDQLKTDADALGFSAQWSEMTALDD